MDNIPEYRGTLRSHLLDIPRVINQCSGIRIFGRKIRSLVFSTDVAIIKNVNADALHPPARHHSGHYQRG